MNDENDSEWRKQCEIEFLQEQLNKNVIAKAIERSRFRCFEAIILFMIVNVFYQLERLSQLPIFQVISNIATMLWILYIAFLFIYFGFMDDEEYCRQVFEEI